MALLFPSDGYMEAFMEKVNADQEYQKSGATWEEPIVFVILAEPSLNVYNTIVARLDLYHGQCRGIERISMERSKEADFIVTAPYSSWKGVMTKKIHPIKGMMQGKLKLKGPLAKIVRYTKASLDLVRLCTEIEDIVYIDEVQQDLKAVRVMDELNMALAYLSEEKGGQAQARLDAALKDLETPDARDTEKSAKAYPAYQERLEALRAALLDGKEGAEGQLRDWYREYCAWMNGLILPSQ